MNMTNRVPLRDPDPPSLGVPAFVVFGVVAVLAIAIKAIIGTLL